MRRAAEFREIHEEFGNLGCARFSLLDVHGRIPDDHPELAERIKSILVEQKSLIDQVRRISQHLAPDPDQLGLVPQSSGWPTTSN
jgi:hypothetical protein